LFHEKSPFLTGLLFPPGNAGEVLATVQLSGLNNNGRNPQLRIVVVLYDECNQCLEQGTARKYQVIPIGK
jgi:hypothetical protein